MVTISHIVKKLVREKPFIQEALRRDIISHAALAEEFTPEIESELGKKVKFSAVNMAIRRYADIIDKEFTLAAHFDKSSITVQSHLVSITLKKNEQAQVAIKKINQLVKYDNGDILSIVRGLHEIMILTNMKFQKELNTIIPKNTIKKKVEKVSAITINLSEKAIDEVGHFYLVTRELAWANINIMDIVSTYTEMTLLITEKDVPRALNALNKIL